MDYLLHLVIFCALYIIITASTNLLVGMANLLTIGQAAFYGIGAYLSTGCLMYFEWSLFPTLIAVLVANGLAAFLLALPTLRLKGDYFVLGTMGFQMIVYTLLYNWTDVTKGPFGIPGIPAPIIWGTFKLGGIYSFLILSLVLMAIVLYLLQGLISSPFGRVLRALREDEIALTSLGRNTIQAKIMAFIISSAFMGWAGFLFATYVSYIDPTSFTLDESIFILSAVLIGGTGNTRGPLLGAILVVSLPEILRFVGLPDSVAAPLRQILYGLLLLGIMYIKPQGLAGALTIR